MVLIMIKKILLTGSTGFLGKQLLKELVKKDQYNLHLAARSFKTNELNEKISTFHLEGIDSNTDWQFPLVDCDIVIHTAARVHIMNENTSNPLEEFRRVNVEGTLNLAKQAAEKGVKQFIFISSIKVNGEFTEHMQPFRPDDKPSPQDPYAISKFEAEKALLALGAETGMSIVIIRPPLIYGPEVKGNFKRMLQWLRRGVPLPLGAIHNKRSLVYVGNLVDLILRCIDNPKAANQVFLVSDDNDLSTTDLLSHLGKSLGLSLRLLPIPVFLLSTMASVLGKKSIAQRLFGTLQVDISKTKQLLDWTPPVSVDEGLRITVAEEEV